MGGLVRQSLEKKKKKKKTRGTWPTYKHSCDFDAQYSVKKRGREEQRVLLSIIKEGKKKGGKKKKVRCN